MLNDLRLHFITTILPTSPLTMSGMSIDEVLLNLPRRNVGECSDRASASGSTSIESDISSSMSEPRTFDYWVDRLSGANKSLDDCIEGLSLGESSGHSSSSSSPSSFDDILNLFSKRLLKNSDEDIAGSDEGRLSS